MAHLTLITGGTRSGKSRFAAQLASTWGSRILYIATCVPADHEMRRRVAAHQRARPSHWRTVEAPADPLEAIARTKGRTQGILLDCLTMYVSHLLMQGATDRAIEGRVRRLCTALRTATAPAVIVTNEVGAGVVPDHLLGRRFRDLAGQANQLAARYADEVWLLVAGLPIALKQQNAATTQAHHDVRTGTSSHASRA